MASTQKVSHPIFARAYRRLAPLGEGRGVGAFRDEALAGVSGRVIEVGSGSGLNFPHYPPTVTEVLAVEPEPVLRAAAMSAATLAPVAVTVVDGVADALPGADESFDAGVVSLVLCSVPDQGRALGELRRVIRPGGELHFYEHVRAENPRSARFQDRVDPFWSRFGGGCHCNRDTLGAIEEAGFRIQGARRFLFQPCFWCAPSAPSVIGMARRQ